MMDQYQQRSLEELRQRAAELHCELVLASPNELLMDLDSGSLNAEALSVIREMFGVTLLQEWESRHGRKHVLIGLARSLRQPEHLILQLALGSDWKRELLALFEYLENPISGEDTRSLFRPLPAEK